MTEEKTSSEKKSLKPAQVIASALAAVTAAFLGSALGVAGTIVGAAVASVVTTVGSELYLRSLQRTREAALKRAKQVRQAHVPLQHEPRPADPPQRPANPLIHPERRDKPAAGLPRPVESGSPGKSLADQPTVFLGPPPHPGAGPRPRKPWWKSRWTLAAGMCVAAFVIGMLVITGVETITGRAVSGGPGTTVSKIGGNPDRTPAPPPASTPSTSQVAPPPSGGRTSVGELTTPSTPRPSPTAPTSSPENTPSSAPVTTTQAAPSSSG